MGPAFIAFAALALQLGAREDEVDKVYGKLLTEALPKSPSEAIAQIKEAVDKVREEQ